MGMREERRKLGGGCEAFYSSLDCLDAKKQKPSQIYLKKKKQKPKKQKRSIVGEKNLAVDQD